MHDAKGNAVTIDLTEDTTHRRFGAATLPVGRRAQLIALQLLALFLGRRRGTLDADQVRDSLE
ncbi:MAG: hypothetical protein ABGZ36_24240, partial [Actinomycetota bacterium]